MLTASFVRGLLLGLAIAAPVGPISLLCMRRALAHGFRAGILSGLGAATADGLYAAVAAFGLVAVTHLLVALRLLLEAGGGLALVCIGMRTLGRAPAASPAASRAGGGFALYGGTLALTLANPTTILSFAALFAGAGLSNGAGDAAAALTVLGVGCGSALWWVVLLGTIALVRRRLPETLLRGVTLVAGLALALFGAGALLDAMRRL